MSKRSRLSGKKRSTWGGKILPALCNIVGTLIIIGVIFLLLPAVVPKLLGYEIYNITSGSMAPEIPIGSVVIVNPVEPSEILENDIIAYERGNSVVVHRAVSNHTFAGEFVTKGDANEEEDFIAVPYSDYRGLVIRHFPYLGGWLAMNTTRAGKLTLMAYLACGCLLNILAGKMRG